MPSPFTDETRGARLGLTLDGLFEGGTLRAPGTVHTVVMGAKPATVSISDRALKALVDQVLMEHMVRGDYLAIYSTVGKLFGLPVAKPAGRIAGGAGELPSGNGVASRQPALPADYEQAQAEALQLGHRGRR